MSQSGLPVSSTKLSQSNVESRATPIQSNVIWPYYPQTASGASFYPQVMGGFYHDPNGIPATLSLNVTSTIPPTANTTGTTMSGASRHNLKVLQGRCQGPFQLPTISTTFSSSSTCPSPTQTVAPPTFICSTRTTRIAQDKSWRPRVIKLPEVINGKQSHHGWRPYVGQRNLP